MCTIEPVKQCISKNTKFHIYTLIVRRDNISEIFENFTF